MAMLKPGIRVRAGNPRVGTRAWFCPIPQACLTLRRRAQEHRLLLGVGIGHFQTGAVRVEEVDRVERAVVCDTQYLYAVGLQVGPEDEGFRAVRDLEGDALHLLRRIGIPGPWRVGLAVQKRPARCHRPHPGRCAFTDWAPWWREPGPR